MGTIWHHDHLSNGYAKFGENFTCPHCPGAEITSIDVDPIWFEGATAYAEDQDGYEIESTVEKASINACRICGWWAGELRAGTAREYGRWTGGLTANVYAKLSKDFEKSPPEAVDELRTYLVRNYENRHIVDPFKFEEVVADVYRSHGYEALTTAKSGDGGIDVVLRKGPVDIGVQVKRYKSGIQVNLLRELLGALVLSGRTEGMFVTTSDFSRGANQVVKEASTKKIQIKLVNAEQFFRDLEIAQLEAFDETPLIEKLSELGEINGFDWS